MGISEESRESFSDKQRVISAIALDRVPNVPTVRATPAALAGLTRHGYSDEEIWALVVPKRTLARRVAHDEALTIEETDRALRLERIATHADRVFGNPAKAHRWLRQPKNMLNGATPLAFLATETGARRVEEMLYQIEHGMFA
jgi:putative toxin-antitoxin system antitoxin component (TIGR02293 family)